MSEAVGVDRSIDAATPSWQVASFSKIIPIAGARQATESALRAALELGTIGRSMRQRNGMKTSE